MTNDLDDYDDFEEANFLLATTLKQLDEAMMRGTVPDSHCWLYSVSQSPSVQSAMNGNGYGRRSTTPHGQMELPLSGRERPLDLNQNAPTMTDLNGNNDRLGAEPIRPIPLYNPGHSTVSHLSNVPKNSLPMAAWNSSITNWLDQTAANKVTSESSGSCTPESSSGGAGTPPSDLIHSSSANGLDDPSPRNIPVTPSPLGKLLQAIDEDRMNVPIEPEIKLKILRWLDKLQDPPALSSSPSMSTVSCPEYSDLQNKLNKLAMARDSLMVQVSLLNEQVGAQKEKIRDLESLLSTKRNVYPYDIVSQNANESQKTDLLNEITTLKTKYAALERDKVTAERRLLSSQSEIDRLSQTMHQIISQQGYPFPHSAVAPNQLGDHSVEMEQLRITVQRLMADNEQKSIEINSLRNALDEHSRASDVFVLSSARSSLGQGPPPPAPQAYNFNAQLRKLLVDDSKENIAHSNSFPASLCSGSQPSSGCGSMSARTGVVQPSTSYTSSLSMLSPQPSSWSSGVSPAPRHIHHTTSLMAPSASFGASPTGNNFRSPSSPAARQLAAELDELRRINGELSLQQQTYNANTIPRPHQSKANAKTAPLPRAKLSTGSSGLNGSLNAESDDEMTRSGQPSLAASTGQLKRGRTRSTLRNLIGKITRSTSQEIPANAFRRGSGIRASASARIATMSTPAIASSNTLRPPVQNFVDWNTEQVCNWLAEVGFAQYVPEAERYIRSGRHLLNLTPNEIEKELAIKNSLHRKRLRCILDCIEKNAAGPADRMDVHQVLNWLDLIGLSQFRDVFMENLIDGQMLLCLTAQDLIDMKITSALNHAALARGIQFLYSVDFHLHRLEKHFNPEHKCPIPNEVEKWSHQCVSHWLKNIDLAEFIANMMYSGIHGALMVHEPSFTAESLAEVLQIPAHKTLLRRHLTTQFNTLLGQEVISHKRETLAQPFVTFLSPQLRVKLVKKGFSLSRKKAKNEVYVEPNVPVFSPRSKQCSVTSAPLNTDI